MVQNKCKKCGHEWLGRVEDPKECPSCKRRDWKEIGKKLKRRKLKMPSSSQSKQKAKKKCK